MKNIKIIISYRGTHYCGWQIQPNGLTVQEVITTAINELTGEHVNLKGSGRTDARVHALGQCANFFTGSTIPPEQFFRALNTKLPTDIRILSSEECAMDFHSRYDAKGKTYLYKIHEAPVASPFESDLSFHVNKILDWKEVERASSYFIGTHDFKAFMASGSSVKSTIRTIERISFEQKNDQWEISFKGNGFLYNMVRIMAGTLYEVGCHRIAPEEIEGIIQGMDRSRAGITAPAQGLYLKEVFY